MYAIEGDAAGCSGGAAVPPLERIRQSFRRSLSSYDNEAVVQRHMAERLCAFLPADREFSSVAEIGCGTGILTRLLAAHLRFRTYLANDIVPECAALLKALLPEAVFLPGDIDALAPSLTTLHPEGFACIVSNACLQWSRCPAVTLRALVAALAPSGVLAVSVFGPDNLQEIRALFGVGLAAPDRDSVHRMLPVGSVMVLEEERLTLTFPSLLEALRHLQRTGVNAFGGVPFSRARLRELDSVFASSFGRRLTYQPRYIIVRKEGRVAT